MLRAPLPLSKSKFNLYEAKSLTVSTLLHRLVLSIELGTVQTGTGKIDPARIFKCTTAARGWKKTFFLVLHGKYFNWYRCEFGRQFLEWKVLTSTLTLTSREQIYWIWATLVNNNFCLFKFEPTIHGFESLPQTLIF